ncbi:MAG: Ms5788A family Cys-rich leader peptide [Acidothermaceae bacterium]
MQQATFGELMLTKRRAVDLCRVATCLCRMS